MVPSIGALGGWALLPWAVAGLMSTACKVYMPTLPHTPLVREQGQAEAGVSVQLFSQGAAYGAYSPVKHLLVTTSAATTIGRSGGGVRATAKAPRAIPDWAIITPLATTTAGMPAPWPAMALPIPLVGTTCRARRSKIPGPLQPLPRPALPCPARPGRGLRCRGSTHQPSFLLAHLQRRARAGTSGRPVRAIGCCFCA